MSGDFPPPSQPSPEARFQDPQMETSVSQASQPLLEDTYRKDKIEFIKLVIDYLKHTTTLSTGSILIVATLMEKFFTRPNGKSLVGVALLCFILSIIFAFIAGFVHIAEVDPAITEVENSRTLTVYIVLAFIFFIFGIVSFTIFAAINLF
jgi:hypothetical protein